VKAPVSAAQQGPDPTQHHHWAIAMAWVSTAITYPLALTPTYPQVIPEGAGPCQDFGDLRFGLSSTAAHTSRWASGSRLGRSPTA
jgi:hypothetical protein